jgi:tetratricopeptide (TPR) repeat protein
MLPLRAENPEQEKTLVSWKEIASFLDRAERTVKRWEHERGLPVHRIPGGERGGVFAYPSELRAWLLAEQGNEAPNGPDLEGDPFLESGKPAAIQDHVAAAVSAEPPISQNERADGATQFAVKRRWVAWMTPPALLLGLAGAVFLSSQLDRNTTAAHETEKTPTVAGSHVSSARAEELYLQGRYEWSLRTADSLAKAVDDYTQAIVQDPAYAKAYAGLAECYDLLPEYGGIDRSEAFSRAKAAADRAIELDPNLAAGHRAKAFAMFYGDWDAPGSDGEFRKAIALAPNEVETHHWYATTLFSRRERSQSLAEIDEAAHLNPTNPAILADCAFLHVKFNDKREANIRTLRELARTQPTLVKASRYLEDIDLDDGNYEAYLVEIRQAATISHNPDESALAAASEHGWERGGVHEMFLAIRDLQQALYGRGGRTGYELALAYVRLGQPLAALRYFNAALENRDIRMMWLQSCNCSAEVRTNADYIQLFRRINETMHQTTPPSDLAVTTRPEKLTFPPAERQSR